MAMSVAVVAATFGLGWLHRPSPARRATDQPGESRSESRRRLSSWRRHGEWALSVVGEPLRRRVASFDGALPAMLGRLEPAVHGLAVVGAGITMALAPTASLATALSVYAAGLWSQRTNGSRRRSAVVATLPLVVELVRLAVSGGHGVAGAVRLVAAHTPGPLGDDLRAVVADLDLGVRLDAAVQRRLPLECADLTTLLVDGAAGTPLAAGLERCATDVRRLRRARAEEQARRVPVRLLFPLVFCGLPAFVLLTVVPLVAATMRDIQW